MCTFELTSHVQLGEEGQMFRINHQAVSSVGYPDWYLLQLRNYSKQALLRYSQYLQNLNYFKLGLKFFARILQ